MTPRKALLYAFLVVAVGTAGVATWQYRQLTDIGGVAFKPGSTERIPLTIPRGTSPAVIAKLLQDKGVVEDGEQFRLYLVTVAKKANTLQAGEFLLSPSMTSDELIAELAVGRAREVRVTVPEGLRKEDIARLVAAAGVASRASLLRAVKAPALVVEFGVPADVPGGIEGYLFPDTYQFPPETSAEVVLRRMHARLEEVITDEMKARMKEMGWTLHQTLTLAAIVEKETGQAAERPRIASVFHNRLRSDPPIKLQTDPTVIYGIKGFNGNIRKKHLRTPHPYNTYTNFGLPPGPIASPGIDAIKAALWPAETDDLFFVSKNDGTHMFCPDLACHQAAVQKWQIEYWRNKRGE